MESYFHSPRRPSPTELARARAPIPGPVLEQLQALFTECLPELLRYEGLATRHCRCEDDRQDRRAVLLGRAWEAFLSLYRRGRPILPVLRQVAYRAALSSLSQRQLTGERASSSPLSARGRLLHGRGIIYLSALRLMRTPELRKQPFAGELLGELPELLGDRRGSDPAERCRVRNDWRFVLLSFRGRARKILRLLAVGYCPTEVAQRCGVSLSRVSQIRAEARRRWNSL